MPNCECNTLDMCVCLDIHTCVHDNIAHAIIISVKMVNDEVLSNGHVRVLRS